MTDIFVFGSNLAGRHGKGAALCAFHDYGAEYHVGVGRTGQAYAIPTKDGNLKSLPLGAIALYVDNFIKYAKLNKDLTFQITAIGCGLAGYTPEQMAPMFKDATPNCILPDSFKAVLAQ